MIKPVLSLLFTTLSVRVHPLSVILSLTELSGGSLRNLALGLLGVSLTFYPIVQKPINVNPRLKINQEVYFSISKRC